MITSLAPYNSTTASVFEVWDFSTINGGGYAVVRRPHCKVAQRTTIERQAVALGPGWIGTRAVVRGWSPDGVIRRYQAEWSTPVDVRLCDCGCIATPRMMAGLWPAPATGRTVALSSEVA